MIRRKKRERNMSMAIDGRVNRVLLFLARTCAAIVLFHFVLPASTLGQEWGNPTWSDEFNSPTKGAPPDASNWTYDVGGTGWGNHELEIYCAGSAPQNTTAGATPAAAAAPKECDRQRPNAYQDGQGHLVIRASRISEEPAPAGTWTSARLKTAGLKVFQYGRMEACMKLPVGAGLWPALWMLGTAGHWPAGGEIDIMENIPATGGSSEGLGPLKVESTIHGPSTEQSGHFSLTQIFTFPNTQRIDDPACHVYGAIWSPFMIQMYVDDWRKPFFIRTSADVPKEARWVYNAPFYFLLNLAVGGDWPGLPDSSTPGAAEMLVDYVRVYKAADSEAPRITAGPLKVTAGTASAMLQVQATTAAGPAFLTCSTEGVPSLDCTVDSGNALNASVVDFSTGDTQTAKVSLRDPHGSVSTAKLPTIRVTAYTASGAQSSVVISAE
jgi:beta-glucanase (GH16 family)